MKCRSGDDTALDPATHQMTGSTGKWEEKEDIKLKDAASVPIRITVNCCAGLVETKLSVKNRWRV
jgi:hypothetical protein